MPESVVLATCCSIILFIDFTCYSYTCTASHKLFKGVHKIRGIKLKVELSPNPPNLPQEQDHVPVSYTETKSSTIDDRDNLRSSNSAGTSLATSSKEPSTFRVAGRGCSVGIASVVGGKQEHQQSSLRESFNKGKDQTGQSHHVITEQPRGRPDTRKPPHISSTSKDRNPRYIVVSGLNDSISTENVVAHFQTARCGGGTVTEVIHLEQNKASVLVGITGIELNREFVINKKTNIFVVYYIMFHARCSRYLPVCHCIIKQMLCSLLFVSLRILPCSLSQVVQGSAQDRRSKSQS